MSPDGVNAGAISTTSSSSSWRCCKVTAGAILNHFFSSSWRGCKVGTYVPEVARRATAINNAPLDRIAARGRYLLITVDCGIRAVGPAAHARTLGIVRPAPTRPEGGHKQRLRRDEQRRVRELGQHHAALCQGPAK